MKKKYQSLIMKVKNEGIGAKEVIRIGPEMKLYEHWHLPNQIQGKDYNFGMISLFTGLSNGKYNVISNFGKMVEKETN